uniref:Chemosensory protein 1 n=1 Tax=Colaphellus bowringi TaxID=561076 RepID=A0A0S3J2I6_9CUCU|nr:chemosensory protein 1 [Colaphellus bowringi]
MKYFVIILSVLIIAAAVGEKYTTKYDNVDIDSILNSERLIKNYMDCLMERGPCTPEGKELRDNLPDALKTECHKCSDKQKEVSKKVLRHLVKNKRKEFDELTGKYDPEGVYKNKYKEDLAKEGIIV